jgi:hypothetical protein
MSRAEVERWLKYLEPGEESENVLSERGLCQLSDVHDSEHQQRYYGFPESADYICNNQPP